MNWLDGLIILNLAISTWKGWKKGLLGIFLPVLGLMVGLLLAPRYYPGVAERLPVLPEGAARALAFLLIVVAAVAAASLLARGLALLLSVMLLGWVNRLGGLAVGLALGTLTSAVALALLLKYPFLGLQTSIEGSALAPRFLERFSSLLSLLPPQWEGVRFFFQ